MCNEHKRGKQTRRIIRVAKEFLKSIPLLVVLVLNHSCSVNAEYTTWGGTKSRNRRTT